MPPVPPVPIAIVFCCACVTPATNEAANAIASVAPIACCLILDLPCGYLFTDLVQPRPHQPATCIVLAAKPPQSPDQAAPDGARRNRKGVRPGPPAGLETPAAAQLKARECVRSRCSVAAPSFALQQRARQGRPRFWQ